MKAYVSPSEQKIRDSIKDLTLEGKVRRFFELLDTEEESDNGRRFKPLQMSCVRTFMIIELDYLLKELKKDIHYVSPKRTRV